MHYYLFHSCDDNGYGLSYTDTYFSSEIELDQNKVNECIKKHNPYSGRVGSNFEDFQKGSKELGIKIELQLLMNVYDKVEKTFYNITGNY